MFQIDVVIVCFPPRWRGSSGDWATDNPKIPYYPGYSGKQGDKKGWSQPLLNTFSGVMVLAWAINALVAILSCWLADPNP